MYDLKQKTEYCIKIMKCIDLEIKKTQGKGEMQLFIYHIKIQALYTFDVMVLPSSIFFRAGKYWQHPS